MNENSFHSHFGRGLVEEMDFTTISNRGRDSSSTSIKIFYCLGISFNLARNLDLTGERLRSLRSLVNLVL